MEKKKNPGTTTFGIIRLFLSIYPQTLMAAVHDPSCCLEGGLNHAGTQAPAEIIVFLNPCPLMWRPISLNHAKGPQWPAIFGPFEILNRDSSNVSSTSQRIQSANVVSERVAPVRKIDGPPSSRFYTVYKKRKNPFSPPLPSSPAPAGCFIIQSGLANEARFDS